MQHKTHPGPDAAADRGLVGVLVVLTTASACKEVVLQ